MLYARMSRWLRARHIERRVVLLALVCGLPSLWIGMQADDYDLRFLIERDGPFAAYRFTADDPELARIEAIRGRDAGTVPWWWDEHFRQRFFRPLASLSLWLDWQLLPSPTWMHLENCLLYGVIVWLVALIFRRMALGELGFGLALFFYALQGSFAVSVGWIAGRNTLLASLFGLACIWLHVRGGSRPLAWLAFALALLSAEFGLCALGYVVAHAFVFERARWRTALLSLAPYALMVGLYLAYYVTAGFGVSGSAFYHDPRSGLGLLNGLITLPVYLAGALTVAGMSAYALYSWGPPVLIACSLVCMAVLLPLMAARLRTRPEALWFALGGCLSVLPLLATVPQDRLTFFVSLGACGLVGPWVADEYDATGKLRRVVARALWRMHGVYMPLLFVPMLFVCQGALLGGGASALDRALPVADGPVTVVLNAPSYLIPHFQANLRREQATAQPPVLMLYAGGQPVDVRRSGERSLELRVEKSWRATPLERFSRAAFHAGDRVRVDHMLALVHEVDAAGAPTRVEFTFDYPLDDPRLEFLLWQGRAPIAWRPPPAGEHLQLAAAATF